MKPKQQAVSPTDETYQEWQLAYDHFNNTLFNGMLPPCLLTFQREKHTMGYFSHKRFASRSGQKTDEIALNPSYFAICPVNEALQTLVHEMTHLWQEHYGSPGRGRYHNKEWADKMESIGLMPSSTGKPGGKRTGDKIADYIIPEGPMAQAITQLKDKGFTLRWMDRYVARPMQELNAYYQVATQGSHDQAAVIEAQPQIDAVVADEIKTTISTVDLDFSRTVQKQGTRIKYSCECGINIWAKPGIDVRCNQCKTSFKDVMS